MPEEFFCYVHLADGKRHTSEPLARRPGAFSQIAAMSTYVRRRGGKAVSCHHDHVRRPRNADSFAKFFRLLEMTAESNPNSTVLVDGVDRFFRRLPLDEFDTLMKRLVQDGDRIFDVDRQRLVGEMNRNDWISIGSTRAVSSSVRNLTTKRNSDRSPQNTARARKASGTVRSAVSDHYARAIGDLFGERAARGDVPGMSGLARLANDRGLRTSRGNLWTDVAVRRALTRLGLLPE